MMNVLVALVPEAPTDLHVAAESTTSIRVTWNSPQETNGPIVTYKVSFPSELLLAYDTCITNLWWPVCATIHTAAMQ